MRVHFDNCLIGSQTGPNTFATRLAKELFVMGHEVVFDGHDGDVSLVFIERSGKPLAPKVVQRIDGIWFKPDEFHIKNRCIKALYDVADAVVFQSNFDKTMIERLWGSNEEMQRRIAIIGNGIDLTRVSEITIPELARIRNSYERVFVCSSNWHPQKRLRSNIELFKHIRSTQHPSSCLIVMGSNADPIIADKDVFYSGLQHHDVCLQVYSAADWMLHLAWADHCPNVVVEALSQGTPVVCSDAGGTKELIAHGAYGYVMRENESYDYQLYDYDRPPEIDVKQLTFLPTRHDLDYSAIPSINIRDVARDYVKLFEECLQ